MSDRGDYARECASRVADALDELWAATDYPEAREVGAYAEQQLKAFLGQWIHVRKACNEVFEAIRAAHPELPGWDPIQKDKPVEQRLAEAEGTA